MVIIQLRMVQLFAHPACISESLILYEMLVFSTFQHCTHCLHPSAGKVECQIQLKKNLEICIVLDLCAQNLPDILCVVHTTKLQRLQYIVYGLVHACHLSPLTVSHKGLMCLSLWKALRVHI